MRARATAFAISVMLAVAVASVVMVGAGRAEAPLRKVALIIGNRAYEHSSPLEKPINDASALSKAFKALGFEVTFKKDLGKSGMELTLKAFGNTAAGGSLNSGEAYGGLARAFLQAGARSLLVSHWLVEDEATIKLDTTFMKILQTDPLADLPVT